MVKRRPYSYTQPRTIGAEEDQFGSTINYQPNGEPVPLGPDNRPLNVPHVGVARPHQDSDNIPMSQPHNWSGFDAFFHPRQPATRSASVPVRASVGLTAGTETAANRALYAPMSPTEKRQTEDQYGGGVPGSVRMLPHDAPGFINGKQVDGTPGAAPIPPQPTATVPNPAENGDPFRRTSTPGTYIPTPPETMIPTTDYSVPVQPATAPTPVPSSAEAPRVAPVEVNEPVYPDDDEDDPFRRR